MSGERADRVLTIAAVAAFVIGGLGCGIGAALDLAGFFRAWLCAYLLWLGVPLAGIALVLTHDLSGGNWMAAARAPLNAAIATMPLASLAGIPAFVDLHALYSWTHPAPSLGNVFYLNPTAFYVRYGVYVVLWNLLAAFALWGPRGTRTPIAPALSWLSALGLVALALSASFAAIDWILSLDPEFWSSAFPYVACAGWFNTGLALVLLTIALAGWPAEERRAHMADLASILLATTIFWAYVEFIQFLIIWEENLKPEIAWYVARLVPVWQPAIYVSAALGFVVPFFVLLWAPSKRNRAVVATICVLILVSRIADKWWLVLPQYPAAGPFWLDAAAILALGGPILLLFLWGWRHREFLRPAHPPVLSVEHG